VEDAEGEESEGSAAADEAMEKGKWRSGQTAQIPAAVMAEQQELKFADDCRRRAATTN
jgi:hypothetical protein